MDHPKTLTMGMITVKKRVLDYMGFLFAAVCCLLLVTQVLLREWTAKASFLVAVSFHTRTRIPPVSPTPKGPIQTFSFAFSLKFERKCFRSYVHCKFLGPRQNFTRLLAPQSKESNQQNCVFCRAYYKIRK